MIKVIVMPLVSVFTLFLITRFIGYRQMSQLSMFDYVNGITIGSIAAELAISDWSRVWEPLAAIFIYGIITMLLSFASNKSLRLRKGINGEPIILVCKGQFYDKNFTKAKLDLSEFMIQCRNQGYFDPAQIDTALMEPNGSVSILPWSQDRPVTPKDMNYVRPRDEIPVNVILDGRIIEKHLKDCGLDSGQLKKQLIALGRQSEEVFLATSNEKGEVTVYPRCGQEN